MRMLILLMSLLALPAQAASLRAIGTLNAGVVRLSDLFDDAGDNAGRILGPAPAPGGRIVVEAPQLAAIARQFGVAWQPASRADRAVLERPGKPLAREAVLEVVRTALNSVGVSADDEIELPGFAPPLIPFGSDPHPTVTQLDRDALSGGFSATITIGGPEMAPVHLRLSGRVHETVAIVVPVRRIQPGEAVRAEDLRPRRVRAANLPADVARATDDATGLTPRVSLMPGQPVRLADLGRPPAIRKGGTVQMLLTGGGLFLAGQAVALESGAPGERIRVQNPASRAVLEATVIGPDRVRVSPDSLPLQPPANAASPQMVLR